MRSGFRPRGRDQMTEIRDGFGWVIGPLWRGVGLHTKEAFRVTRLTFGASNDLQMARNLTGGLPVVYQGHLASLGPFRERLTPSHDKETRGVRRCMWEHRNAKRTTGKMLGCMR